MRPLATLACLASILVFAASCGEVKSGTSDASVIDASLIDGSIVPDAPVFPDAPPNSVPNGQGCTGGGDCQSGICVDSVCCNTECTGQCEACDVANSVGACTPVTGAPHGTRTACTATDSVCGGACDGAARDACAYPTVECRAASCTGATKTSAAVCSMGACPAPTTQTCGVTCGATDCLTVTDVTGGYSNTCALLSNGTVRCWGNGIVGQNGYPRSEESYRPKEVPGLTNVKQITTGGWHTCALLMDGTAKCWGSNELGELGRGTTDTNENTVPMPVLNEIGTAPLPGIQQISAGQFRTCAAVLLGGGRREVRCWGYNVRGSLGNGSVETAVEFSARPAPVCTSGSVAAGTCSALGGVFQVSVGDQHVCARTIGGATACWGSNSHGQIGFAADTAQHPNALFVKTVPGGTTNLLLDQVHASHGETGQTTCAIRLSDKAVICWGRNRTSGMLGRNSFADIVAGQETPSPVCNGAGCGLLTGSFVSVGDAHACSITLDKVRCWGNGGSGQLGDNSTTNKSVSASDVATAANVRQMAAGDYHTCAILVDGRLQCWGDGEADGLIDPANPTGSQPDSRVPVFPTW